MRQHGRGDTLVIADQIALGQPIIGKEHLVPTRHFDCAPVNFHTARGHALAPAWLHCTLHDSTKQEASKAGFSGMMGEGKRTRALWRGRRPRVCRKRLNTPPHQQTPVRVHGGLLGALAPIYASASLSFLISSMSNGTILCRSPTMP